MSINWRAVLPRLLVLVVFVVVLIWLYRTYSMPTADDVRAALDGLGAWQFAAFILGYACLSLVPFPSSASSIAGGLLFGIWVGSLLVMVGATLGAVGGFLMSRWVGLDGLNRIGGDRLRRIQDEVAERGFITVLLARLIPILPFNGLNYAMGLTRIRLSEYTAATALGIIPGVVVYVAVGAYGLDVGSPRFYAALAAFSLLTLAGVLIGRRRQRTHAL